MFQMSEMIVVVESELSVQQCWLSRTLFKSTGAKFGQNAVLSIGHTKYLCQLLPREDFINGYVELQTGVSELNEHMKSSLAGSRLSAECLELQSIQSVKTVSVNVILSDLKKVSYYKRNPSAGKLEEDIKTILRGVSLKENFCLRWHDTPLGKLLGIAYIVVNKLPKNVQCGRIKPSAKITVDNIMSLNKFKQKYLQQNECSPVGGFEKLIAELREFVERAHKHEDPMLPRGCLLHGPSGSGKTSLVRHVASVMDAYMVRVKGAEVIGARPGDTERNLSRLFEEARDMSEEGACILFLDELDALAGNKGKGMRLLHPTSIEHCYTPHYQSDQIAIHEKK
jgi:ATP-dependent Zn protease